MRDYPFRPSFQIIPFRPSFQISAPAECRQLVPVKVVFGIVTFEGAGELVLCAHGELEVVCSFELGGQWVADMEHLLRK